MGNSPKQTVGTFVVALSLCSCNTTSAPTSENHTADTTAITVDTVDTEAIAVEAREVLYQSDSLHYADVKVFKVERLSGKDRYGGKTKVEWKPIVQLINEELAAARKQMETPENIAAIPTMYKRGSIGGEIRLDVYRNTIGGASNENFTVIVKDSTDAEVFRTQGFPSRIPSSSGDDWWMVELISVAQWVRPPFYIYVIDALAEEPFKFRVTPVRR